MQKRAGERMALRSGGSLSVDSTALSRPTDPYLTLREVAALAGVHKATVHRWIADPALSLRELVVRLPGGQIRIQESQFRRWLSSLHAQPQRRSRS
jgi:excisionase family DNA binding protein